MWKKKLNLKLKKMAAYILLATKPKMLILMAVDENVNIAVL